MEWSFPNICDQQRREQKKEKKENPLQQLHGVILRLKYHFGPYTLEIIQI